VERPVEPEQVKGKEHRMAVQAYMVHHEVEPTVFLGTALVDLYGNHGRLRGSTGAFEFVCKEEVCTWNALLLALANELIMGRRLNC